MTDQERPPPDHRDSAGSTPEHETDGPPEIEDAAEQEVEYPADETDEG